MGKVRRTQQHSQEPQALFNPRITCRSVPALYCFVADKDTVLLPNPSFPSCLALFSLMLTFFASSVQSSVRFN